MYGWKRLSDGDICQTATASTADALFELAGFGAVDTDKPIKGMLAVPVVRIRGTLIAMDSPSYLKSEMIRIAACIMEVVPSDLVDDYPQKTYSASRVARMMEKPQETARMLAYQLRQLSDSILP